MIPVEVVAQSIADAITALKISSACSPVDRDIAATAFAWGRSFWAAESHTGHEDNLRFVEDPTFRPDARPLVLLAALRPGISEHNCGSAMERWRLFQARTFEEIRSQSGTKASHEQLLRQLDGYLRDTLDTREGNPHALWLWTAYKSAFVLFFLESPSKLPEWWDAVVGILPPTTAVETLPPLPLAVSRPGTSVPSPGALVPSAAQPPGVLVPTTAQLDAFVEKQCYQHPVLRRELHGLSHELTTAQVNATKINCLQFLFLRYWQFQAASTGKAPTSAVLAELLNEDGFRNSRGDIVTIVLLDQILNRSIRQPLKRRLQEAVTRQEIEFEDVDWKRQVLPAPDMEGPLLPKPRPQ